MNCTLKREWEFDIIAEEMTKRRRYVDEGDVDRGLSVRERSKQIIELIHDSERLNSERKIASKNRAKYSESISSNGSSAGHFATQSHFKKNDPTWRSGDEDFDSKPYGGQQQKPAFGGFDSDSDEGFAVPKTVPKKEPWKPFDDSPPSSKPKNNFNNDDDESWAVFDVKKGNTGGATTTTTAPVVRHQPQPVQQQQPVGLSPAVYNAPIVNIPVAHPQPPKTFNPLDGFGGPDLIGSGTLLVSTPADKPLPNLFGAPLTPSTPSSGGTLPNLFGAPASSQFGPTTTTPSTLTPNAFTTPGFGSSTPSSTSSPNAFETPSFGSNPPATTANSFAYPPGSFGTPVTHGYPPNYSYPSTGY